MSFVLLMFIRLDTFWTKGPENTKLSKKHQLADVMFQTGKFLFTSFEMHINYLTFLQQNHHWLCKGAIQHGREDLSIIYITFCTISIFVSIHINTTSIFNDVCIKRWKRQTIQNIARWLSFEKLIRFPSLASKQVNRRSFIQWCMH